MPDRIPSYSSPGQAGIPRLYHEEQPEVTAAWKQAHLDGMAPVLLCYTGRGAHFYWSDLDEPRPGACVCCGERIRVDRLDLVVEHLRVCRVFTVLNEAAA